MDTIRFCAKCGHDINAGAEFCPYCGNRIQKNVDPISAGARYEHYEEKEDNIEEKAHWDGHAPSGSSPTPSIISKATPASMTCFKCGNTIPIDSKFCPVCQVRLFEVCPKCGHKFSAKYANCNECGTNREEFLKLLKEREEEQELQRRRQEEALRQARYEKEKMQHDSMPRFICFKYEKHQSSGQSDDCHITIEWKTINASSFEILGRQEDKNSWKRLWFVESDSPIVIPQTATLTVSELADADLFSLLRNNNTIILSLRARSINNITISKQIKVKFWWSFFSLSKILDIEEL